MFFTKLRAVLIPALLLLLLSIAFILFLDTLIKRPSVQVLLLARLSDAIGYQLRAGNVEVSLWDGIGFKVRDFEARSRSGADVITSSSAVILFDSWKLLRGHFVPTRISLSRPRIELAARKGREPLDKDEVFAFAGMLAQRLAGLDSGSLKDGQIRSNGFPFELENLYLDIFRSGESPGRLRLDLKGEIESMGERAPFTIQGTINHDSKEGSNPSADMTLSTGRIPLTWLRWPASLLIKEGGAEARIEARGSLNGPVSIEGKILAEDVRFFLERPGRTKEFYLPRLVFGFDSLYSEKVLQVSSLKADAPDFSQTISLKVDFQDSSNPYLDLRIESPFMPLKTFKRVFPGPLLPKDIENRIFPLFSGGDVRLALFSLKGTLDQIRHLRKPENAEGLSVEILFENLEMLNYKASLPFYGISGGLGIENGHFYVSGMEAEFGRSIIRDASLEIKRVFFKDRSYQVSLDGLFGLSDLIRHKEMDLISPDVRRLLHGFVSASGDLEARFDVGYESDWDYPRISRGEFSSRGCSIAHKGLVLPLLLDEADLRIDRGGQIQFRCAGQWGDSGFKISGSAENSLKDLKTRIEALVDVNEVFDHFCQEHRPPVKFSGPVACLGTLSRKKELWSCQGEVDLEGVVMDAGPFYMDPPGKRDKIIIGMELHPGQQVRLDRFGCSLGDSSLELSGFYSLKDKDSFRLNVETASLDMKDLGIYYKKTDRPARGLLSCQASVNGSVLDHLKTSVNGEIVGQELSFVMSQLAKPITDCHFRLRFSGKEAFIDSARMQVGRSPIHLRGNLRGWDGVKGELTVDSNYLILTDLI
ncbi:MAG: hypothetical protein SV775_16120 [Thermodesulfobacteriota bacterium]|nr:hypothetical protein [Thermodesulfobacteriota bacterium]